MKALKVNFSQFNVSFTALKRLQLFIYALFLSFMAKSKREWMAASFVTDCVRWVFNIVSYQSRIEIVS